MAQRRNSVEIIRFERVGLAYSGVHTVLHDLDYSFTVGSFSFITGVSGAGKTSLLKLIYRSCLSTSGIVRVFGRDVTRLSASDLPLFRQRMGLVFQDCKLFDHLTVLDNVALSLKIIGTDLRIARSHARELLDWVGLNNHLNDSPSTLSDGQKQRVAVARAVITRPLLLIADEPTGNLDHDSAFRLMRLFEELNKIGTTVLVATHNKELVKQFQYPELEIAHGQIITRHTSQPPPPRKFSYD